MGAGDYHLDYKAFDANVLCADWMLADMLSRAERMKALAEAIAPEAVKGDDTDPHYRDCFEADAYLYTNHKTGKRRASGVLRNTSAIAIAVEFGTGGEGASTGKRPQGGNSPEHATLRKALDAAG